MFLSLFSSLFRQPPAASLFFGILATIIFALPVQASLTLHDINPGTEGSNLGGFTLFNGKLYFSASDATAGLELWSTDGSTTARVMDINPGTESSSPYNFTILNGKLYFIATDATAGLELWSTDGTTTARVMDINPGAGGSYPFGFTVFNGKLYFSASDPAADRELWSTDGTTTARVTDINPGAGDSFPYNFTVFNGKLYFVVTTATDSNEDSVELWVTDGITTHHIVDLAPPSVTNFFEAFDELAVLNGRLFFTADNGVAGTELMVLDPMQLTSRSPANAATSVSVTASALSLTFSEAITAGTGVITLKKASDNSTTDSIDVATSGVSVSGQTATISLSPNVLAPNTTYYVVIPPGAFKGVGNEEFFGLNTTTDWTFTTGVGNQTITFDAATPTNKSLGDAPFNVSVTGGASGNAVILGSSTPAVCSVSSNTVTLVTVGTCTLTANQAGNSNYNIATQVTHNITVSAVTQGTVGDATISIDRGSLLNLQAASVDSYTTGKPANMEFTHGVYSYRVVGLSTTIAETVKVTLVFASAIPSDAKLYKVTNSGYTEITGVTINGNTVTFSITDNGSLDANSSLGTIDDPIALGTPANSSSGGTASSGGGGSFGWMELLFAVSVLGAALRRRSAFWN